jgi:small-conductance mechanosensitive channel
VKTEVTEKEGVEIQVNRFMIEGEGKIKYTYNNGMLAQEAKTAARNFLNALEKLPGYMEQEEKKIKEYQRDLPVLEEVINSSWKKEHKLGELKTQLAVVERKIQLSLLPIQTDRVDDLSTDNNVHHLKEKNSVRSKAI